jgi:hypothetical protein
MKFTNILKSIILENSRFKILYDKMVAPAPGREGEAKKPKGLMDFETLKAIILADPTTRVPQGKDIDELTLEDMDNVKVGKYTQWLLNLFVKPYITREGSNEPIEVGTDEYKSKATEYRRLFLEDLSQFTELLVKYDRFKGSLEDAAKKDINNVKSLNDLSHLKVKVGDETVDLNMYRGKKIKKEEALTLYYDIVRPEDQ